MGKGHKDRFQTYCWNRRIIKDPYQVIANFFCLDDINSFRILIRKFLLLACKYEKLDRKDLSNFLLDIRGLKSLIMATNQIVCNIDSHKLQIGLSQFNDYKLYATSFSECPEWEELPKFLNDKEFLNPYKAIQQFFKFQKKDKWLRDLDELLDFVFDPYYDKTEIELLPVYLSLTALVEASHLIYIREIFHINGSPKPYKN